MQNENQASVHNISSNKVIKNKDSTGLLWCKNKRFDLSSHNVTRKKAWLCLQERGKYMLSREVDFYLTSYELPVTS